VSYLLLKAIFFLFVVLVYFSPLSPVVSIFVLFFTERSLPCSTMERYQWKQKNSKLEIWFALFLFLCSLPLSLLSASRVFSFRSHVYFCLLFGCFRFVSGRLVLVGLMFLLMC
jgi:hypothetical protein